MPNAANATNAATQRPSFIEQPRIIVEAFDMHATSKIPHESALDLMVKTFLEDFAIEAPTMRESTGNVAAAFSDWFPLTSNYGGSDTREQRIFESMKRLGFRTTQETQPCSYEGIMLVGPKS